MRTILADSPTGNEVSMGMIRLTIASPRPRDVFPRAFHITPIYQLHSNHFVKLSEIELCPASWLSEGSLSR